MENPISSRNLMLLVNTVQELSLARNVETVMTIVRRVARQLTGADGATFVLRDRINDDEYCYYADEDAIGPLWKGSKFPIRACISGWAMLNKRSVVIDDIYKDERIPIAAYEPTFVRSLAMVPIRTIEPIGAIGNYWAKNFHPSEQQVQLLQSLADITAVTLENIKVYDELEQRVKDRTVELHEKNREILDSISYAKRIQDAILPPPELIKKHLPESFILYRPKDIVAGDFYWFEEKNGRLYLAVCDCTGHGVPGAMVSVVCSNALYRSVNEFALQEPGEILDKTRELVIQTFSKSTENINDGMDISLCAIDQATREISWSGANLGLYFTQDNTLETIRPHKQPIGQTGAPTPFPTHTLRLQKGSMLYLHSDGYIDQFGGKDGKKFMRKQLEQMIGAIKDNAINEQLEKINNAFDAWKGNHEQVDDVTVIGIRM